LKHLPDTVSFLKSQGHVHADRYPVWRVWWEAGIAKRRLNLELASNTTAHYVAAVAATPGSKKSAQKATKLFNDFIKGLTDG